MQLQSADTFCTASTFEREVHPSPSQLMGKFSPSAPLRLDLDHNGICGCGVRLSTPTSRQTVMKHNTTISGCLLYTLGRCLMLIHYGILLLNLVSFSLPCKATMTESNLLLGDSHFPPSATLSKTPSSPSAKEVMPVLSQSLCPLLRSHTLHSCDSCLAKAHSFDRKSCRAGAFS